ncbi:MAG: hypothetical protein ACLFQA_09315 [Bacteroidales bacterium]
MKTVIQILLSIAIVVLGYLLVDSIMEPINFQQEQKARYNRTIERLKDIRAAQIAYRSIYGEFTGSFDTLIHFINNDSFRVVTAIGFEDEDEEVVDEEVIRDTVMVSVRDSLFPADYVVDSLRYVPFTGGREEFFLGAGEVMTGSGLEVEVFEVHVHNNVLLQGLNQQLVINMNDERIKRDQFPGLRVGSLTETTNNAGNWE